MASGLVLPLVYFSEFISLTSLTFALSLCLWALPMLVLAYGKLNYVQVWKCKWESWIFLGLLLLAQTYKWEKMGMWANLLECSGFQCSFSHVSTDESVSTMLPHPIATAFSSQIFLALLNLIWNIPWKYDSDAKTCKPITAHLRGEIRLNQHQSKFSPATLSSWGISLS